MIRDIKNVVVVGGGTAGCLSALLLNKRYPKLKITMVRSKQIGVLGPGEGLTTNIHKVFKDLKINVEDVIKYTNATIKNGVVFSGWNKENKSWFHGFNNLFDSNIFYDNHNALKLCNIAMQEHGNLDSINLNAQMSYKNKIHSINSKKEYSLHLDAKLLGDFLENEVVKKNIEIVDAIVVDTKTNSNDDIVELSLDNGTSISLDFLIDASGFSRLFLDNVYNVEWIDTSNFLPATSAIACKLPLDGKEVPYTQAIAMDYGWAWKVALQNRYGCGYVYDNKYINEDDAIKEAYEFFGKDLEIIKTFNFTPGYAKKILINNCLGIGLSTSFFEPMEATAIAGMINALYLFLDKYFYKYINNTITDIEIDYFNNLNERMAQSITSYLYMHYVTNKTNTNFWSEFLLKHPMPEYEYHNIKRFIEDMETNKKDFSYIMQPPSWLLYSWISLYAGNSFKVSKDSFDKNELEEYTKIVEKINNAAEQYDDFKITI